MRLGIMGGTFDPIHLGHLLIAEEARVQGGLDRVVFLPAGVPWLKAERCISSPYHRLAMVRRAIATNPHFEASPLEMERPGNTYTVDTLEELCRTQGPTTDLFLILGLDALRQLPRWKDPQRLLELCTVMAVARPGHPMSISFLDELKSGASQEVILLEGLQISISGAEIRRRVARGLSIRYWVPDSVEEYILQHGLYRKGSPANAT